MSSVIATWRVRSTDLSIQQKLTVQLEQLGRHVERQREAVGEVALPVLTKLPFARRGVPQVPLPAVRLWDGARVRGKILVNLDLFRREARPRCGALEAAQSEGVAAVVTDQAAAQADAVARRLPVVRERGATLVVLPEAVLHGVDFHLHDPRNLYPGEDRMALVFVRESGWPLLDGMAVQVQAAEQCREVEMAAVRTADFHLSLPSVHLRYFLEEWCRRLFAWMRRYAVANLEYTDHETNNDFAALDQEMEALERESGVQEASAAWFGHLLQRYDAELRRWVDYLQGLAVEDPWGGGMG